MLIACKSCHRQYDVSGIEAGEPFRCHCGQLTKVAPHKPQEARMVHCSGCGGKLRPQSSTCDYCGGTGEVVGSAFSWIFE